MKWGMRDMPSKTSWFNREIFLQNMRDVGWVGLLYFLGLLFSLPLQLFMLYSSEDQFQPHINNLFEVSFNELQYLLMLIIPILLAVFLFRYLQVKSASDLMHSFPITRQQLFHHHILTSFLLLTVPVVLTALVVAILSVILQLGEYVSLTDLFIWMGSTLLIDYFLFLVGVFVGMLTGISVVQGVLTFIILLFPVGICVLFVLNLKFFLYGFAYDYFSELKLIENFSPITRILKLPQEPIGWGEAFVYIMLSILFYSLSLYLYKKRNLETVSQAIAFRQLRPVFKYGVTFCAMLLGGAYFGLLEDQFSWTLFGYFIGSIIGYFVAEMVLQKTWRVFGHVKGYVGFFVAAAVLITTLQFDVTGFEKRVPNVMEIEKVYFTESPYVYFDEESRSRYWYIEPENIQSIVKLHKQLIKDQEKLKNIKGPKHPVFLMYELENGNQIIRQYFIHDQKDYKAYLQPIYESSEYKENQYEILQVRAETVSNLTIVPSGLTTKRVVLTKQEDIREAISVLKDDFRQKSFEDIIDPRDAWATIELYLNNGKVISLIWEKSNLKFEKWLETRGFIQDARVMPKDIQYALVFKQGQIDKDLLYQYHDQELFNMINRLDHKIKVDQQEQIEAILRNTSSMDGKYLVALYYTNGSREIRGIEEEYAPDFIKEQFENIQ
jgi:ABC-2 type transport system permease protein